MIESFTCPDVEHEVGQVEQVRASGLELDDVEWSGCGYRGKRDVYLRYVVASGGGNRAPAEAG